MCRVFMTSRGQVRVAAKKAALAPDMALIVGEVYFWLRRGASLGFRYS